MTTGPNPYLPNFLKFELFFLEDLQSDLVTFLIIQNGDDHEKPVFIPGGYTDIHPSIALSGQGRLVQCSELYAIDGDTISCDGINMRDMGEGAPFVSGYDTPEIRNSKCEKEQELGRAAKNRMSELLETPGIQIECRKGNSHALG